jgi:hypothetical protein
VSQARQIPSAFCVLNNWTKLFTPRKESFQQISKLLLKFFDQKRISTLAWILRVAGKNQRANMLPLYADPAISGQAAEKQERKPLKKQMTPLPLNRPA